MSTPSGCSHVHPAAATRAQVRERGAGSRASRARRSQASQASIRVCQFTPLLCTTVSGCLWLRAPGFPTPINCKAFPPPPPLRFGTALPPSRHITRRMIVSQGEERPQSVETPEPSARVLLGAWAGANKGMRVKPRARGARRVPPPAAKRRRVAPDRATCRATDRAGSVERAAKHDGLELLISHPDAGGLLLEARGDYLGVGVWMLNSTCVHMCVGVGGGVLGAGKL